MPNGETGVKTSIETRRVPVELLKPAKYNPRLDLQPGDAAYEKIMRSPDEYGYVDPLVWNEVTGNIVGGHQRYIYWLRKVRRRLIARWFI